MSEEHVFGRWLLDFKLETERVPHAGGGINAIQREQGAFVPFTQVVRSVCQSCNNGWLSALEANAKDALTPILAGFNTELSATAAMYVATWAFKTALVAMMTFSGSERRSGAGVPEGEYRAVYAARKRGLPSGTQAWLGRYSGLKVSSVWIVPFALTMDGVEVDPNFPQGYAVTLALGPFVVHAFRWTAPLLDLNVDFEPRTSLDPLAPSELPIRWLPNRPSIDDEALVQLAMGRWLSIGLPGASLRPWGPAADPPPSELVNGRVMMPVLCGLHSLGYPYELVVEASEGREHVFWGFCSCGEAYLIQTETDAAHLRKSGAPDAISALYDELPGELVVLEDHLGSFACKRLVR